jgi:hypothetical protein
MRTPRFAARNDSASSPGTATRRRDETDRRACTPATTFPPFVGALAVRHSVLALLLVSIASRARFDGGAASAWLERYRRSPAASR